MNIATEEIAPGCGRRSKGVDNRCPGDCLTLENGRLGAGISIYSKIMRDAIFVIEVNGDHSACRDSNCAHIESHALSDKVNDNGLTSGCSGCGGRGRC